ncbi:unnamed protein product [Mytilus edulis]|uniref:Heat shock 70 kDa protein 12B n=1 Tax=Mytilus edulis TaxID=6550 RepID=A0A8S3Q4B6_MYTED|nr:unnamed protein product [Mytilus edulis]
MACGETISEALLVAAIDLGTTFSGYAFAIRNDYKVDPTRVSGSNWHAGSQPGLSLKTLTCILFNQNQVFESFGGEAEDKYTDLAQEEEHMDWFFFKRFKMQLSAKKEIARDFMLEGENDCVMPAMRVFTENIKFLRIQLEEQIRSKTDGIKPQEIVWVLTVPAVWSDQAKQFLREAANNIGEEKKVDQAFDEFMLDIVGLETMDKFRNEDKAEYLSLCREFEVKKRSILPDRTAKITLRIPLILSETFQKVKGIALKDSFKSNKSMEWVGDKLRIDPDIVKAFFSKSCRQITHHLNGVFQEPAVVDTEIILMVVIIPEEPGLAVLKGAVQFGYSPKVINPRISQFTYGISTIKRSRHHTDPEDKTQIVTDIMYCRDRFGKHVERDEPIEVGEVTDQRTNNSLKGDQRRIRLPINASFSVDSEYVDDTENSYLGDLKVDVSDIRRGCEREVVVGMRFEGRILLLKQW